MAQVNLDVVYNVKGMQALKQSQTAMNQAANAARGGTTSVRGYNQALTTNAAAATKSGAANTVAAKGYRATGFAAVGASGGVKSFGVALSAALGPIAAITGGLALVSKTIGVFSERQADVAVLTNGLKNLGLQGTPALDALQQSADKLGKTTLFDQEQFTRGYALLTSFKQIGVSSYERVATAAADLAQTTGQDLNSALLQLSKALEDPARRVTDLSRSGTVFTEQQKEQIRVLQESGDILGAQAIILGEIEKQYGGAAEAAGSAGFAGAMDSLGEATRDLMEQLGENLVPMLTGLVKVLSQVIGFVNQLIQKFNELGGNKIFEFLLKPAEIFGQLMGDAAEQVEKTRQNAEGAAPAVSELADQVREMPTPVKETADNMEKLAGDTNKAKAGMTGLKGATDAEASSLEELKKKNAEIQESIALQKQLRAEANGATGEGAAKAGVLAQNEGQAAQNAQQLAQAQAGANAQIAQGAAEAANLAANLQAAGAAAAGGGGGGGDGTRQWTNAYKPIVTKKLDADGNIVDKTDKEIKREENALKLSGWKGGILKVNDGGADTFAAAAFDASWFAAGLTAADARNQAWRAQMYGGMIGAAGGIVARESQMAFGNRKGYADGGYVTGPQQAVVGEGGEPEYIIPASKMDSAMQRYGSGMRGSSVIPESANVSVNYSGSTVDMGGTSYINKGDVNGIVSQAVNQTLSTLAKSPRARLGAGLR